MVKDPLFRPHSVEACSREANSNFRLMVLQELVDTQARSSERGAELRRAHRKWGVSIRTLQRWLARFEAAEGDFESLARGTGKKHKVRRVWVSRVFDREYALSPFCDPRQLPLLQDKIDQLIKAAWASPAQRAGWKQVSREVLTAFKRHLQDKNIVLPEHAFVLSQRRVRELRYFRIVDVKRHDRKVYDDQIPRVRRANNRLSPMQQVVMDVKVVDCALRRPDQSIAWPRMIAFLDVATQRLFRRFVLLKPGEGIRQEHVAQVFLEMASDPLWGFPQQIYRDNGSEFFVFDLVRSAIRQLQDEKVPTIINARPYSAASKPIESKFATLDRFVFSQMQGWTGGDRIRKKVAHLGRPPKPFAGSLAEFAREADDRIRDFENIPIGSGPFVGKAPVDLLEAQVSAGWRPVLVPRQRLDAAFCSRETRRVSRGALSVAGHTYRHPDLVNGQTVTVALPWRRGAAPLVNLPNKGWEALELRYAQPPIELAGVLASDKLRREHDAAVARLRREAGKINLAANRRDRLRDLRQVPDVAPILDMDLLPQQAGLGEALKRPQHARADAPDRRQKENETQALERELALIRRTAR